jgi:F-type H+-transporting ATPase subunit epsilon
MSEQKHLKLTISRVDAPLFDGEVTSVTVPGAAGEMTLLAQHTALISPLKKGTIVVKKDDNTVEQFEIESGTLEISNNHATILI